ncbi:MAG: hypothetical protein WKF84_01935 [Pyrinomonadaceae bacterium]
MLALSEDTERLQALLGLVTPLLPRRMYAHLSGNTATALGENYDVQSNGAHYKMALAIDAPLGDFDTSDDEAACRARPV